MTPRFAQRSRAISRMQTLKEEAVEKKDRNQSKKRFPIPVTLKSLALTSITS